VVKRLHNKSEGFGVALNKALGFMQKGNPELSKTVHDILTKVCIEKDSALISYTNQFDRTNYEGASELKVHPQEIDAAVKQCAPELLAALEVAAQRIRDYHARQLPKNEEYKDALGNTLGWRWHPVGRVGLYVPGGAAVYPSSVLMNAIPAITAGVNKLVMVVPAPEGVLNLLVLVAAHVCGITEVYKIGGAQAVAALAFGTETIPDVDMIVGPGNKYVAEAKKQVFGAVGIDMIAGPSEILVIADDTANAEWIAADLLSQSEHDADARCILVTPSGALADKVEKAVNAMLKDMPRKAIASKSWENNGLIVTTENLLETAEISNHIAPEHLELMIKNPADLLPEIRHAGAVFMGHHTPEAIGDYIAGPSHVLPTSGSARFSSGISVFTFLKRSSLIGCSPEGFKALADATHALAEAEGLFAHARSVSIRKN
jgi:histidinol dehydrogenase